jgi:hypothetical protein
MGEIMLIVHGWRFHWRKEIPRLISNSEESPWFYSGSHTVLHFFNGVATANHILVGSSPIDICALMPTKILVVGTSN